MVNIFLSQQLNAALADITVLSKTLIQLMDKACIPELFFLANSTRLTNQGYAVPDSTETTYVMVNNIDQVIDSINKRIYQTAHPDEAVAASNALHELSKALTSSITQLEKQLSYATLESFDINRIILSSGGGD